MKRIARAGALLVALFVAGAATAQSVNFGGLGVRVTRAGQPVANATVCIGTSIDLNAFHQGRTDSQGNVRFSSVPPESFVATANADGRGVRQSYTIATRMLGLTLTSAIPIVVTVQNANGAAAARTFIVALQP